MNTDGFSQQDLAALLSTLRDEERRRFLYYEPYPKQREFHNNLCIQRLISGGNQSVAENTRILRLNRERIAAEWVAAKDIKVGDTIYDGRGNPTTVDDITVWDGSEFYRIEFEDGRTIDCDINHRWSAKIGQRHIHSSVRGFEEFTMREILQKCGTGKLSDNHKSMMIPLVSVVDTPARSLPIDPYLMGHWLGNGWVDKKRKGGIRISCDEDCYALLKALYKVDGWHAQSKTLRMSGIPVKYLAGITGSHNKYIPDEYLLASHEQRKQLFMGLMDSDGCCEAPYGRVSYYTVSERLARDVLSLAYSLGCRARILQRTRPNPFNPSKTYTEYCVRGLCPFNPFKLKRRGDKWRGDYRHADSLMVKRIDRIENKRGYCFHVTSPEHTYICENYIVTHNTGKSFCTIMETCFHCTGLYPDWWKGHRPTPRINTVTKQKELRIWYLGTDNQTVRNSLQSRIIGTEENNYTDGAIHVDYINLDSKMMKRNVSAAVDKIRIRHVGGFEVELCFKSYEQGRKNLQSEPVDIVVFDEEPPADVYAECVARLAATDGFYYMAFTPLLGMTPLVHSFWMRNDPNKSLTTLSVYDSPHFTQKMLDNLEARYSGLSPSEKRARMLGLPAIGAGMVYPIEDESLIDPDFPATIPNNWKQIGAIDFGRGEHPFAAVWVAIDPLTGVHYLYDCIKVTQKPEEEIAELLKRNGDWIPFAYPHDLMRNSGISSFKGLKKTEGWLYKNIFEELGLTMTPTNAMLPEGGIAVEPGIVYVRNLMHKGLLKVHPKLEDWWEEKRLYAYGDDSRPKKVNDDLMDAMRYALIMTRFAASKREMVLQALVGSAEPKNETPVFHHAK